MGLANIIIAGLIVAGATMMIWAIFQTSNIRQILEDSLNHHNWRALQHFMIIFLAGDLISAWVVLKHDVGPLGVVTAIVYFLGAIFVLITLNTSRTDIDKIQMSKFTLQEAENRLAGLGQDVAQIISFTTGHLRSPVNNIAGLSEVAQEAKTEEEMLQYLKTISASARELQRVTKMLNSLTEGKNKVVIQEIKLKEAVEEVIEELREQEDFRNIDLQIEIDESVVVSTDRNRLKVILEQLLSNAYKFRDRKAKYPYIKIGHHNSKRLVEISIEDNGVGVDKQYHDKIFHMFYKASDQSGDGMGLFIANQFVKSLKGKINVFSGNRIGSTFTVKLPLN